MATVFQDNTKQEDENEQTATGATPSSPLAQPSAGAAPLAARQGSSNRPNIRQYLQANQGAGQSLAQGIQQKAQNQASVLNRKTQETGTQLQAKANPLAQELGQQGQERIQTAFKDPQAILQNQDQLSQFQRLRDQGANQEIQALGQEGQQVLGGLKTDLSKLTNQTQAAGTESGRFGLLRNAFSQPTYNRGQQRLDQLFLQAQPGAARGLQQGLKGLETGASQQITGVGDQFNSQLGSLSELSGQRAGELQSLFGQGTDQAGLETDLTGRGLGDIEVSSQQRKEQAMQALGQVPGLRERLTNNTLTNSDLQALGLKSGQRLFNTDLGSYITQNDRTPENIGLAETADPEEFARYNALRQLSAAQNQNIFGGATEAGTFRPYEFDAERLQSTLAPREAQFEQTTKQAPEAAQNVLNFAAAMRAGYPLNADSRAFYDRLENAARQAQANPTWENLQALRKFAYDGRSLDSIMAATNAPIGNPYKPAINQFMQNYDQLAPYNPTRLLNASPDDIEGQPFSSTFGVK